jgi:hypothetical protein
MLQNALPQVMNPNRKTISLGLEQSRALEQIMDPGSDAHAAFLRMIGAAPGGETAASRWGAAGHPAGGTTSPDEAHAQTADGVGPVPTREGSDRQPSEAAVLRTLIDAGLQQLREVRLDLGYRALADLRRSGTEAAEARALAGFAARAWADAG